MTPEPRRLSDTPPPNLLMVFPDELRAQALGSWQGRTPGDPVQTPNLDAFAAESRVMEQMVSNYPLCTPFRGMLMTGQYPLSSGVTGNCHDTGAKLGIELSPHAVCWSDVLKGQGYSLGYVGKWHLDAPFEPYVQSYNNPDVHGTYWNEWTPPGRHRHGFDFWHSYGTYDLHLNPMYWTNDTPREAPIFPGQWGPEHEADVAIAYLRNEGGEYRDPAKPFALVVSMNPPHHPYDQIPEAYRDLYAGQTSQELNTRPSVDWDKEYLPGFGPQYFKEYLTMVTGVDDQFGRILRALDEEGLSENTLVVFFSDHGCCLGAHGQPTKDNPYEESMRVPMMFRLPGQVTPGRDQALMSAPDIYPTVLGLLGFGDAVPGQVEGTNLAGRLRSGEGETASSQLYLRVPYGQPPFGQRGVRTLTHTLVVDRQDGEPLTYTLFDNVNDPYQLRNVADEHPELVQTLIQSELLPWLERTRDPWRPIPFTTAHTARLRRELAEARGQTLKETV